MWGKDLQYHNVTNVRVCINLPPQLNSESLWAYQNESWLILRSVLPTVQLQISLIYFGTLASHIFLSRFGIPRFTSMTISGLIFATTFNETWDEKMKFIFSVGSQEKLGLISVFGYILFLFYIGVKTDMTLVPKTGGSALKIGTIAILAPFVVGMAVQHFFCSNFLNEDQKRKLLFITGMLSLSPFPVISSVLSELNILNSEIGRLGLSSAIISDVLSFFMTSIITFSTIMTQHRLRAFIDIGATILFILIVVFVLRKAMFRIIKNTPEGCDVSDHYVYGILTLALFSAYASHQFDLFALFGPYILGLAVPEGPPLGTAIIKKIDTFVNGVFMPMFVTVCAMRVDLKDFMKWKHDGKLDMFMVQCLVLVVVTFVAKFVFCMLPPLHSKMPLKDAASLSLIMSCKGIVEMATYSFFRDIMGIPNNVFAFLMMCMILNATAIPMLLKNLYDPLRKYAGYTKRNIIDLSHNSELRVLTCIHRPDNIPSAINLLEATYPTKEEPLGVYVLHLIELIGRSYPIFISHQLQKKTNDDLGSFSDENLRDAFNNFAEEFKGHLTVNTFTAVSPSEMMHDDICKLALDKLTSLIVLPFHQKWSSDGNFIELDDKSLRDLNYSILERAPCSVGILIERAQMTHTFSPETPYNVCLLFIGGRDDREALIFAQRMTKNPHVTLSVVRFLASNYNKEDSDSELKDWEGMCDTELLKKMRKNNDSVKYREEIVRDGPETALIVRSMVSEYDLIIVGRRFEVESSQTSGLIEWSEFPELGILGDLLVSTDVAGAASVFVMQQQRTASKLI